MWKPSNKIAGGSGQSRKSREAGGEVDQERGAPRFPSSPRRSIQPEILLEWRPICLSESVAKVLKGCKKIAEGVFTALLQASEDRDDA